MKRRRIVMNEAGEVVKGGCLVRGEKGYYLLIKDHRQQHWGLPKGHTEPDETPEETAVREVEEEAGYRVVARRELPAMAYVNGETGERIRTYIWLADAVRQTGPGDTRHGWFTLAEAKEVAFPNLAEWLERLRADGVIQ